MSTKVVMSASVYCHGIKKRCRKAERHSLDLPEVLAEAFTVGEASEQAVKVVREGMKALTPGSRVFLVWHQTTVTEELLGGVPMISRTFGLASGQRHELTARFQELGGAA